MIAVDTNILVYAHRADLKWHPQAAECLRELVAGRTSWALPWPVIHEFFSVLTNRKLHPHPTPPGVAIAQIENLLESPNVRLIGEGSDYWRWLREYLGSEQITGGRVHDARIAAICRQNGVRTLWTADRDFSQFPGLHYVNPLAASGPPR